MEQGKSRRALEAWVAPLDPISFSKSLALHHNAEEWLGLVRRADAEFPSAALSDGAKW
jgi:hypothetical protein